MKQWQEIKQTWTGQENFIICFCVILDTCTKDFFWKVDLVLGSASTNFWYFSNIF